MLSVHAQLPGMCSMIGLLLAGALLLGSCWFSDCNVAWAPIRGLVDYNSVHTQRWTLRHSLCLLRVSCHWMTKVPVAAMTLL